jgi:hypothetical protein
MAEPRYGVWEKNDDDGESYLIDNFIVECGETEKVLFEGTNAECRNFIETMKNEILEDIKIHGGF